MKTVKQYNQQKQEVLQQEISKLQQQSNQSSSPYRKDILQDNIRILQGRLTRVIHQTTPIV